MKVALTFEGLRRRHETRAASAADVIPPRWQHFTGLAVAWIANPWSELFPDQRARLFDAFFNPFYLPPVGMSTFPQRNPVLRRRMALTVLSAEDECFPETAERFEAAGFVIVAVDCKTRAATVAACRAMLELPKKVRRADVTAEIASGTRATAKGFRMAMTADVEIVPSWRFNHFAITRELEAWDRSRAPSDFMSRIRL